MNPLAAGIAQYNAVKPDSDIDLIRHVRELMIERGLKQKVIEHYDTNRFIMEAQGKLAEVQRFFLNRYFSQQLSLVPTISIDIRYSLIPDGEISTWCQLFENNVLPFVLNNDLPRAL